MTLTSPRALELWRDVLSARVAGDGRDMTERQMAILLTVYTLPPPHTVRGLSMALKIAKPAVTRALDTLGREDLIRRRRDDRDRRNVFVEPTQKGSAFVERFGASVAHCANDSIAAFEIHHILQRRAAFGACDAFGHELRGDGGIGDRRHMRRHRDLGVRPQRARLRQRLGLEHVQRGARKMAGIDCRDQVGLVHDARRARH